MAVIHYRHGESKTWAPVPEGIDYVAWARTQLLAKQFQDSDSGYAEYIEFHHPDGTRSYAYATYDSFDPRVRDPGVMLSFEHGDEAMIAGDHGAFAIAPYPFSPDRDWINLPD